MVEDRKIRRRAEAIRLCVTKPGHDEWRHLELARPRDLYPRDLALLIPTTKRRSKVSVVPDDVESLEWAAERLHIGISTAYRLAKAGKLQGVFRVGTQYRVSVPAFMEAVHGSSA